MTPREVTNYLMWHYGSHQRPYAVLDMIVDDHIRRRDIWRVIQREWSMFDRIPHREYQRLFSGMRPYWMADIMAGRSRAMYDALPAMATLYRGLDACNGNPRGLS